MCDALHERSEGCHESGAFMLGHVRGRKRFVEDVVFYDDLEAGAYDTGIVILHAAAFSKLWAICRAKTSSVVGDVHLHIGQAFQSAADIANPMIAQRGHLAMILPRLARAPIEAERVGLYEYRGRHHWRTLGHNRIARHLRIGI